MSEFALSVENVSVAFGATQALSGASFKIKPGEVRALLGANGAGKSTLIKIITGVHRPDSGTLLRDGQKYAPDSPEAARREGVYAVFQELSIFPHLTVLENIFAGAPRIRSGILDQKRMRSEAQAALSNLGHNIPLESLAGDLAVSNQQIIEIVRATVNGAKVLLLDEPTSSLNAADRARLFDLIRVLKSQGTAIIYISHFLNEVLEITDTFTVLRDGKLAAQGTTSDTTVPSLSEAMFGRKIDVSFKRTAIGQKADDKPLLEVDKLVADNVKEATLSVKPGEVLGIFGLVDCGAAQLLDAIFGLRPAKSGAIRLSVTAGTPLSARWRAKGIGMVAEDRPSGLAMTRTIAENICVVDWARTGSFGIVSPRKLLETASHYIERFGIKCRGGDQNLGELSGGNQQKASLARFTVADVDVLLLSEPTRGVDIAARMELWKYIDELAGQGKAAILATTDVEEALALSDNIMVMRKGKLLARHSVSEITPEQLTIAATGGTE